MDRELKILLIEDVPTDADLVENELKKITFPLFQSGWRLSLSLLLNWVSFCLI